MIIAAQIISQQGGYLSAQPCDKIEFVLKSANAATALYPECASYVSVENPGQQALVSANYYGTNPVEILAAFNLVFGVATWLALALHAIGIEIYVSSAPSRL
jgi:hypothetical protein